MNGRGTADWHYLPPEQFPGSSYRVCNGNICSGVRRGHTAAQER